MTARRVVIVTHYWPPHVGGIETVAAEQAHRLAARGWECTVMTSRLGDDPAVETHGRVSVHRYRCLNAAERLVNVPVPIMSHRMYRDLTRVAARGDVVVAHGHAYLGSLYAARAASLANTPFVVVQHNPWVDYPHPVDWIERAVDRTLGRWVLHQARTVIAVSEHTARYVGAIAPHAHTVVVHSGVDTRRFHPCDSPNVSRPRFVTVRRLVPRNGVDTLVHAWRRARLTRRAELLIAGDGPQRAELRALARPDPSIRLLGRVAGDRLPDLYRQSTAVVLPSRSGEGFGLVAAEALASGTPVIATRSGGVTELVNDGVNGLLVPPDQPHALADAMRQVAFDPPLAARLRTGARACHERLGWLTSIRLFEDVLTGSAA